jgi:hypothetical protein
MEGSVANSTTEDGALWFFTEMAQFLELFVYFLLFFRLLILL